MTPSLVQALWLAALAGLLAAAVARDVAVQRIPNAVVACGALAGLALSMLPGGTGLGSAAAGLAAGLLAFLPLYILGGMGAGDVKLMAAVGAFTGWPGVMGAVLFTLLAGGALSLGTALWLRKLKGVLCNVRTGFTLSVGRVVGQRQLPRATDFPLTPHRVPYAVAIATGTAAWLIWSRLA